MLGQRPWTLTGTLDGVGDSLVVILWPTAVKQVELQKLESRFTSFRVDELNRLFSTGRSLCAASLWSSRLYFITINDNKMIMKHV